tara:strand:- start:148 stop:450 length:303 start_codon:yes stop_codon:yes gene_type:complete
VLAGFLEVKDCADAAVVERFEEAMRHYCATRRALHCQNAVNDPVAMQARNRALPALELPRELSATTAGTPKAQNALRSNLLVPQLGEINARAPSNHRALR